MRPDAYRGVTTEALVAGLATLWQTDHTSNLKPLMTWLLWPKKQGSLQSQKVMGSRGPKRTKPVENACYIWKHSEFDNIFDPAYALIDLSWLEYRSLPWILILQNLQHTGERKQQALGGAGEVTIWIGGWVDSAAAKSPQGVCCIIGWRFCTSVGVIWIYLVIWLHWFSWLVEILLDHWYYSCSAIGSRLRHTPY